MATFLLIIPIEVGNELCYLRTGEFQSPSWLLAHSVNASALVS